MVLLNKTSTPPKKNIIPTNSNEFHHLSFMMFSLIILLALPTSHWSAPCRSVLLLSAIAAVVSLIVGVLRLQFLELFLDQHLLLVAMTPWHGKMSAWPTATLETGAGLPLSKFHWKVIHLRPMETKQFFDSGPIVSSELVTSFGLPFQFQWGEGICQGRLGWYWPAEAWDMCVITKIWLG